MLRVLVLLPAGGQYTPDNDACDTQVGCLLQQEQIDKGLKPAGYWLRLLCDVEWRYGTTHKKRLAVV